VEWAVGVVGVGVVGDVVVVAACAVAFAFAAEIASVEDDSSC
jgi:hypothetical protein